MNLSWLVLVVPVDDDPEGRLLVGLLRPPVDQLKVDLGIAGDLRVRRVGGDDVPEVLGALAEGDLRAGALSEDGRLVAGLLHLDGHVDPGLLGLWAPVVPGDGLQLEHTGLGLVQLLLEPDLPGLRVPPEVVQDRRQK